MNILSKNKGAVGYHKKDNLDKAAFFETSIILFPHDRSLNQFLMFNPTTGFRRESFGGVKNGQLGKKAWEVLDSVKKKDAA